MDSTASVTGTTGAPSTLPSIMKDLLHPDGACETYHGARMNQKALSFHTQLHEWCEAQTLVSKHALAANRQSEHYLPVKKQAHVEYWTRQVNKYFQPMRNSRPKSGSFMKIDVSKFNMKVNKVEEPKRSKSAYYPNRLIVAPPGQRAITGQKKRYFGNDVNVIHSNIAETQAHYSAQRRDLYSGKSKRTAKSAKTEPDLRTEYLDTGISEIIDYDNDSADTLTIFDQEENSKTSDTETSKHIEADILQPQIVARSWSNRMLNVISIDDCKLTCRFRPQIIKENRKLDLDEENDQCKQETKVQPSTVKKACSSHKSANPKSKPVEATVVNGNEADDEAELSTDTVHDAQESLQDLDIDDLPVDTNNNTNGLRDAKSCQNGRAGTAGESDIGSVSGGGSGDKSRSGSSSGHSKGGQNGIKFEANYADADADGKLSAPTPNFSSRGTSKTSYGRVTNMNSDSSKSRTKNRKNVTRTSRINHAINDVVKDRKVMNSQERDFDTRTAEYGRTVVDSNEGSDHFRKLHANLRKKIDQYMDTHSAINTKEYYEKVRKNSTQSSNH